MSLECVSKWPQRSSFDVHVVSLRLSVTLILMQMKLHVDFDTHCLSRCLEEAKLERKTSKSFMCLALFVNCLVSTDSVGAASKALDLFSFVVLHHMYFQMAV